MPSKKKSDCEKNLNKLNRILSSGIFIDETDPNKSNHIRLVRTLDGTFKSRTHNIHLENSEIFWENNNSKQYRLTFLNYKEAIDILQLSRLKIVVK